MWDKIRRHWETYKKEIEKGKIRCKYDLTPNEKVLVYIPKDKDKMTNEWHKGYRIVRKCEPAVYIVTNERGEYRLNKSHVKKDLTVEEGGRRCRRIYSPPKIRIIY